MKVVWKRYGKGMGQNGKVRRMTEECGELWKTMGNEWKCLKIVWKI